MDGKINIDTLRILAAADLWLFFVVDTAMNKKCLDRNRHFGALDGFEFNVAYQRALQLSEVPRILQIQILTSSAYLWSKLFLFGGSEGNALVPQHQVEFHFSSPMPLFCSNHSMSAHRPSKGCKIIIWDPQHRKGSLKILK